MAKQKSKAVLRKLDENNLHDVLYLSIGIPISAMAMNLNLILSSIDETILSILSAAGAGLLWSATIISVLIVVELIKYVGRKY